MKVATAGYPLDWLDSWSHYEDKIASWVSDAARKGAELLVFPEYAAMELASLDGADVAQDIEKSLWSVADRVDEADALHARLAEEYALHILAGSAPARSNMGARPVNRARLFSPNGQVGVQDKQIMTRYERSPMEVESGGPLQLFSTDVGRIGILICYDAEFPLFGRALSEADILLVPSCTEALSGYSRVRIGAMARALENQCVSVMASLVGKAEWTEVADVTTGRGGVFGPPDVGFPPTGVLAEGEMNVPAWTYADIDLEAIAHVRADGRVLNRTHWDEQAGRDGNAPDCDLRG